MSVTAELREAWDDTDHGRCDGFTRCDDAVVAAIAEIERLTARVARQEECIAVNVREYLALEAERDRLRAAVVELCAALEEETDWRGTRILNAMHAGQALLEGDS